MKRMTLAGIALAGAAIFVGAATTSAQTPTTTMSGQPTTSPTDTAKAQDTTSAQATTTTQTTTSVETTTTVQPAAQEQQSSCTAAPAVASRYVREQADRLKMPRATVVAEITKDTGADGEFAGLKPCEAGYPNAVRFYVDEVIKAGTNHSTP
jgi:hypothetical protein